MGVTLFLLALLAVFLKGFREIGWPPPSSGLPGPERGGAGALLLRGLAASRSSTPARALFAGHSSPLAMVGVSILLFVRRPGPVGFETGVAVMPLVRRGRAGPPERRIRNTRKLLLTAAAIRRA
jgi:hypothetical protein